MTSMQLFDENGNLPKGVLWEAVSMSKTENKMPRSFASWRAFNQSRTRPYDRSRGRMLVDAALSLSRKYSWRQSAKNELGVAIGYTCAPFYAAFVAGLISKQELFHFIGDFLPPTAFPSTNWSPSLIALNWVEPAKVKEQESYPAATRGPGYIAMFTPETATDKHPQIANMGILTSSHERIISFGPHMAIDEEQPIMRYTTVDRILAEMESKSPWRGQTIVPTIKPFPY